MPEYRFLTTWCVDVPIGRVFEAIDDAGAWPAWWKGVTRADLVEPGSDDSIGRVWRFTWRSRLPTTSRSTAVWCGASRRT